MDVDPDCIFCRIVGRQAPASIVDEDGLTLSFLDTRPINPGHTLVIPKAHAPGLSSLAPEAAASLFRRGIAIAAALRRSGVRCDGVNLHLADGEAAGQEVFHVHLHAIPRFRGDGFGLRVGPGYGRSPERKELDAIAESIRRSLGRH